MFEQQAEALSVYTTILNLLTFLNYATKPGHHFFGTMLIVINQRADFRILNKSHKEEPELESGSQRKETFTPKEPRDLLIAVFTVEHMVSTESTNTIEDRSL